MRIEGESDNLRRLTELFGVGEHRVVIDSESYTVFESPALDSANLDEVSLVAEKLIELVNGAMRAVDPSFEPVRFARHLRHPEYGERTVVGSSIKIRWRTESNNLADSDEFAPRYFDLALSNPDVAEVLRLLRQTKLEWAISYKVFEVVRQACGGEAWLIAAGWSSQRELSSFRAAANRPDVGGEAARHARVTGQTPKGPFFTLNQGQNFVLRLAKRWMETLFVAG